MFRKDLKDKYSFLTGYFEQGFKNFDKSSNKLASIIFYGQDISAQYDLATEIARLLNCRELKNEDCNCLNCKWTREKQHPAILTISKIDNKPSDDDSKTVISVKQSQFIKNSLLNTSDYHRVFIFCDAKIEKDGSEDKWIPLGLNEDNFHSETANSLLKIIEEPPPNTTFFFLTRDKNDLIETIISRSQSFFVPSYNSLNHDYSLVVEVLENYPQLERKNSFDLAQSLYLSAKEHGNDKILNEMQNFLLALLKTNLKNNFIKPKILIDLNSIELAKKQINNHINPQLAFENLCLDLTK
jgi:hypothetical protein